MWALHSSGAVGESRAPSGSDWGQIRMPSGNPACNPDLADHNQPNPDPSVGL